MPTKIARMSCMLACWKEKQERLQYDGKRRKKNKPKGEGNHLPGYPTYLVISIPASLSVDRSSFPIEATRVDISLANWSGDVGHAYMRAGNRSNYSSSIAARCRRWIDSLVPRSSIVFSLQLLSTGRHGDGGLAWAMEEADDTCILYTVLFNRWIPLQCLSLSFGPVRAW